MVWVVGPEGFRVFARFVFKVLNSSGLGFRVSMIEGLGFWILGFGDLGFWV